MQHIFLTQTDVISPRWQQAFPHAKIIMQLGDLPPNLNDSLLWVLWGDEWLLNQVPIWLAAGARIVVLTKIENPQEAKQVVALGGSGYLHYLAVEPVLIQASQVVALGGLWLGTVLMRELVVATAHILPAQQQTLRLDVLTVREKSVANAVAAGKTNKEVARDLDITERTVKAHLSAVFEKLQIRDRLQLVLLVAGK